MMTVEITEVPVEQDVAVRYQLISDILSAKPNELPAVSRFRVLLKNDFEHFANWESSLANEAEAVLRMHDVLDRLQQIAAFPHIFTKTIGAIGGGFSSGKSAFLNSFFIDQSITLPVGINPVTSLPSYVVASESNYIHGHSENGGVFDIDLGLFNTFTPGFLDSFSFRLRDYMPMMSIGVSLDPDYFQNLCLVDTPGYNPNMYDEFRSVDRETAMSQLQNARFIIWMIGLDSHGTLPKSDIDFLTELKADEKKIYIVLNKADLKAPSEITDIMDEIAESLDDYDIPYVGLSAYSANERKEYSFRHRSIWDFLKEQNIVGDVVLDLTADVEAVFEMYRKALCKKQSATKDLNKQMHSLGLDILQMGELRTNTKAHKRLSDIRKLISHDKQELDEQLWAVDSLRQ